MNKERNQPQNHFEKLSKGKELVDGIFDKKVEWFVYVPWTLLFQELVPLQHEDKITKLHYKMDKTGGDEFIARFFITDKIKGYELINIDNDYFPTGKEEKSKKRWTSLARQEAAAQREHRKKIEKSLKKLQEICQKDSSS